MDRLKLGKRVVFTLLLVTLALVLCVSVVFVAMLNSGLFKASAEVDDGGRVTMKDLMGRYPIDYVVGPIDVKKDTEGNDIFNDTTGKYEYIENDAHKDINGNYTNNIYGVPADQYFNVENYIYTTGDKDSTEGRTLYGWKPDIRAVLGTGTQKGKIAENGKIMSGSSVTDNTGIYATFETGQIFGSTERYVLIVPSDITRVGTGSAAFVYGSKSYYQDKDYISGTTTPTGKAYTDFSCFIYSDAIAHYQEPYFWQPRERLVGIYFPDDSRLTTIEGATYTGASPTASTAWGNGGNRTYSRLSGKGAFERCDSLRFLILPNGLTSIGKHAFYECNGVVDMNIPTSVGSIGAYAFMNCKSVRVLPRPTTGVASTAFNGCSFEDESTIYIMGGAPTTDSNGKKVYDTGLSGFIFKKNGSSWEAKGLAGETGEDKNKVFIFPDSGDFSANSDRRRGVAYDYIDRDGIKTKNTFPAGGVTSYKIADNFAYGKWCQNIIMPKAVTEIGANAFGKSHVKYLETYATKIGSGAFTESENNEGDDSGNQWYYFHMPDGNPTYSIPNDAFVSPGTNVTRHIVFESKAMRDSVGSTFTGLTNLAPDGTATNGTKSAIHYQIPVYAHVYSEDGETINGKGISLSQSDMAERFFNDSDYVSGYVNNSVLKQGDNVILYTKRLSGFPFEQTKQATGGWVASGEGEKHSNPTLDYMSSTVWYTLAEGADTSASASYQASTTAYAQYNSSTSTRVDIYTKKIAAPDKLAAKTYEFGKAYAGKGTLTDALTTNPAESQGAFTFASSLDLRVDYVASIDSFTYPNGNSITPAATYVKNVRHAGTYSLVIGLDAKWGEWKNDYQVENRKATVTVERQKFDLTSLDKIPEFVTSNGETLRGNNTTLYRHNNGWFLTQQNGEEPISTVVVTNGYVYETGNDMTLDLTGYNGNDEKSDYGYLMSTNAYAVNASNEYYATYTFSVKFIEGAPGQTDYEFYYGASNDDTRFNDLYDDALGLRLDRKTATGARVSKRWYIVTETNFFVDSATGAITENTAPYAPVYKDGNPVYSWTYEDELDVKTPKLAYNRVENPIQPQVEIVYTPVSGKATTIKEKGLIAEAGALGYYINSAMPVGEYVVTVYGDAVDNAVVNGETKRYLEIVNTYTLTVNAKPFDSAAVNALHETVRGGANGNAFPLDGKKLHGNIASDKDTLENTLNVKYAAANANTYWKSLANGTLTYKDGSTLQLYDDSVVITYNREGSGNFIYYSYDEMLASLALAGANEYKFYFSISAKNYKTIGGANASDRQDYDFNTVWYTDMKVADIYKVLIGKVASPYFQDVTYTGSAAHVSVQPSQYYSYTFNDADYVNVGRVYVTLTLYDAKLAAWNTTLSSQDFSESEIENASNYFKLSSDGESIKIYYDIKPATNSWSVVPQMASWSFNGFDKAVNFITAGLAFDGAEVEYALSTDLNNWTTFTVDGNGMVSDVAAEILNKLKPGAYYLRSTISDITGVNSAGKTVTNVNGIEFISKNASGNYITTINIAKAVNSWTETPTVMTWTWGSYDKDRNTISAAATYPTLKPTYGVAVDEAFVYTNGGAALPVITFSIQRRVGNTLVAVAGLESFTLGTDVSDILAGLHAGTYVLTTSVGGSDYYTPIAATSLNFVIAQAVNSWTTTPQITQWTWGQFNKNVNVISAEAQFNGGDGSEGSQDNAITFSILNGSHAAVNTTLSNFVLTNGAYSVAVATALNQLPAGAYFLRAEKVGNNDYATIAGSNSTDVSFNVAQADNSWQISPAITSWQYNRFSADTNFIAGVPVYSSADQVVYKLVIAAGNEITLGYTYKNGEIVLDSDAVNALNGLTVGNYTIKVTLAGTDDYSPLPATLTFSVTKATTNSWTTLPEISGWTYGKFTSSLFTDGEADFGTRRYTVQYVNDSGNVDGDVENYINLTFAELSGKLATLGADNYNLYVTSAGIGNDADNYVAATHNIRFAVAKAANNWQENHVPTIDGWTFGSAANTPIAGATQQASGGITSAYYEAHQVDGVWVANLGKPVADITKAGAGTYAYVTTAAASDNYDSITHTAIFEIARANNSWKSGQEPEGTFNWTYGTMETVVSSTSGFVRAEAEFMPEDFLVTYVIKGANSYSQTVEKRKVDGVVNRQPVLDALKNLNVGSYEITVTVEATGNYSEVSRTTYVTVSYASFEWMQEPTASSWTWGVEDSEKVFVEPTIKAVDGSAITYAIGVKGSGATTTYSDTEDKTAFEQLQEDLFNRNANTYQITVTVSRANYISLSKSVDVTVGQAQNAWTSGNPAETVSKVYSNKDFALTATTAKYGTVNYKYVSGSSSVETPDIAVVNAWINGLGASDTAYTLTIEVAADADGNYAGISAITKITVTGVHSVWDNQDNLSHSYTFTYGDNLSNELKTVVIPNHELHTEGEFKSDTLTYTLVYNNYSEDSSKRVERTFTIASAVTDYLAENAKAGFYTITAVYNPGTGNYTTLTYPIDITVKRATAAWDKVIKTEYIDTFEAVEMPTPTAGKQPVTITVVDSNGKSYDMPSDGDLNAMLNKLNVGTYMVTSEVIATDNYTGLTAVNTRVVITAALNDWTEDSVFQKVWEFERLEQFNVSVPNSLRGTVRCIVKSTLLDVTTDLNDYLNSYADSLFTEGDHSLSFVVEADPNGNYNGLVYDCTIRISKKANGWVSGKAPEDTHNWSGTVNVAEFVIPVSQQGYVTVDEQQVSLLRFDIVKAGSGYTAKYGMDEAQFKGELAGLVNGTYTVTMRVGGSASEVDLYKGHIEAYNKNYVYLEGTTVITVTPHKNGWNTELENASWVWNENITLTAPEAKHGNGTITYYVSGTSVSGGPFKCSDFIEPAKNAENAFNQLLTFLGSCRAGTYTVTASVAATDEYEAAQATTALVVISVAPNEWITKGASLTVEYGSAITLEYTPKFNLEKMTIKVNNSTVADNDLNEYFKLRGVGTYTINVVVAADTSYGALEDTITVIINRTSNGWEEDTQLEIVQKDSENNTTTNWVWGDFVQNLDDGVGVKIPIPQNGNKVVITVTRNGNEQFTATLNYEETVNKKVVNSNDFNALIAKLRTLNVGTYFISAAIPESANYSAYTQKSFDFTIEKATNSWIKNPEIEAWNYNTTTAYPDSTPKYGNKNDVQYSYAPTKGYANATDVPDDVWEEAQPIQGGLYYIRGILQGTDNYSEIVGYNTFSIGSGDNAWVNMPGVIAWTWSNYNKGTNQFSGSARSGGVVKFTISKLGESGNEALGKSDLSDTSLDEKKLQDFTFVTGADGKATKYISDDVAKVLNALKPGKYNLYAVVVADENYQSISGNISFEVGKANNSWTTAPNMLSYSFNSTTASGNRPIFTEGKSKYGTISYQITGTANGGKEVSINDLTASDIVKLINGQYKENGVTVILNAGNYILKSWVAEGQNYNEFYNSTSPYQVLFSVARIENNWKQDNSPKTSINEYYTELHKSGFDFNNWFGKQQTVNNDEIVYTLLNTNQTVAKAGEFKYSALFDAIKGLPAGDYIVRMAAKESGNYLALSADTSLTIKRYANEFTAFPTANLSGQWQLSGEWKPTDNTNATTLDAFTVTAAQGNDAIIYTINDTRCESLTELQAAVAQLNAGSYQVTISVEQTDYYEGLSRTVQLDIAQGSNALNWSIDSNWTWHNGLSHLGGNKPKYGNQVYVEITNKANDNSSSSITIDYSVTDPLAIANRIICGLQTGEEIIGGLDAGTYTIKVTASATANWAEVSESTTFTISKSANGWVKDNEPALNGTLKDNAYVYSYGDVITPSASAQHGVVKYTYYLDDANYANGNAKPLSGKPANVGNYVVEVSVDATTNFEGITATKLRFEIDKVLNDSFIVSPSAVGWTWGSYNRTVHMFTGIPRSEGNVSFSILDENKNLVYVDTIPLDKMLLVCLTEDGEDHITIDNKDDFDRNVYLESKYALLVSKLIEGSYYLQINVEATTNNIEFSATTPFRVEKAQNGWDVTPKIASWSLSLWSAEKNSPQAKPKFGEAHIVVTSKNNNEVFYDNTRLVYNEETDEYEVFNRLQNALAGWYSMTVTVEGVTGCYNGLEEVVDVQVYMRGSNETKNYWYETFGISAWEARIDGIGSEPYGTPLRGLPYFEFYYAKGEGSAATIDWDRPVVEGEDSYLVSKGDNKYYKDFYVPMKPGYYFMVACAVNVDSEGNVIEADTLRETKTPYPLHIEYRVNDFVNDPHIDTLLFLGDRINWAQPTATALLTDSEVWFTYSNLTTGDDLGKNMPTEEGKYRVTAHILAKYSEEKTKSADFTVELSTNEWVTHPTIEDWSEEFLDNDPEAATLFGGVITYTYENVETGEIFDYKPTTEGTYKMTATVKLEGYKDLVGTSTFTIDPAYDRDLLIIDLVLGLVGCALAVFVIYFAIRRYKEN